ncbi:CYTH and CHAD domain-containing protein [Streptomyces varsoviensis]|uniref:CYTH and CHAD domain-containing protein n=1 Tax=Streptomyces varsoviensis TaxID=67373 RepID=UPI0007C5D4E5|nr:CYTH and CHAD domain-containing protein [Streptomyces varsoviensis]
MADTVRECERKYEAAGTPRLPSLTGVRRVATVADEGVVELDAVYYDTADRRLAAAGITLRRRTGGDDAGWHLKLPVAPGVRDEVRAPLADAVPGALAALVRSRVRTAALVPLLRLRTRRGVHRLLDGEGRHLAEVAVDAVLARRLDAGSGERSVRWSEVEVELAERGDEALLDAVEKKLLKAGLRRAADDSKLARGLRETEPEHEKTEPGAAKTEEGSGPGLPSAGLLTGRPSDGPSGGPHAAWTAPDYVLVYIWLQVLAIVRLDPDVRRDRPDSVHQMRVATRRTRSALRSYGKVLDRTVTDPIGAELRWLAGELGVDRDREVLTDRLTAALGKLPGELRAGPVRARLRTWSRARRHGSRRRLLAVLDGERYLTLLDTLDALVADPPLRPKQPKNALVTAVLRDYERLGRQISEALEAPAGPRRDAAMHEARKSAKRTRYAAEAAAPALGEPAERITAHAKALQGLLGEHQDSVMARLALRELAAHAQDAGESAFTYGVLYGREERAAAECEEGLMRNGTRLLPERIAALKGEPPPPRPRVPRWLTEEEAEAMASGADAPRADFAR